MVGPLTRETEVRRLISAAGAAPSIHNTQPWRFHVAGPDVIELHADSGRMLWIADPRGRAMHLSCGAALFNLRLAIRVSDYKPLVWMLPDPGHEPTLLATIQLVTGRHATFIERELYEAISLRHTNRAPFSGRTLPGDVRMDLEHAADAEHAALRFLNRRDTAHVLELAAAADRALAADPLHLSELRQWTTGDPTGDGVPPHALGPVADQVPAPVRDLGRGRADLARAVDHFEAEPQIAVLSTVRDEPADWLRAGQALQHVLLTATRHGAAASFLYQPIERHEMHPADGRWPWPEQPQMIIRLGYGPPSCGTPRRPFTEVLDLQSPAR